MATAEPPLCYADSSALVKLVIDEPESELLAEYLSKRRFMLATSRIALVEVPRATAIADGSLEAREETRRVLDSCLLVDVTDALLRRAADLTSVEVRTLDAIHLASAHRVEPDEVIAYDRRFRRAAETAGFAVAAPGAVA